MKQHKLKTELGEFIAINTPIVNLIFKIFNQYFVMGIDQEDVESKIRKIERGDVKGFLKIGFGYEILGFADQEEVARQVVKQSIHTGLYIHHNGLDNIFCYKTATESLSSLLNSEKIFTENPYQEPSNQIWQTDQILFNRMKQSYEQAQNNLWQKILLLKKIG